LHEFLTTGYWLLPPVLMKKLPITPSSLYDLQLVEDPQISPDGRQIAFVKVTHDKIANQYQRAIWLATLGDDDTRPQVRQFTSGSKDSSPRWRPDGKQLAFVSARGGKPQIYCIDLGGGEARAVTSALNGAGNPVWSPDGKRLAFIASLSAEERRREDAGETDPPPADALEARHRQERRDEEEKLRYDPRRITRLPYRYGTEYLTERYAHLYVMDRTEDQFGAPYRLTEGDVSFSHIAWARDGKTLFSLLSRAPDEEPLFHIDIIRIEVGRKRKPFKRVTRDAFEYFQPTISPDGKWLAAIRQADGGSWGRLLRVCVMPVKGGPARDLTVEFDRSADIYMSAAALRWSPDSRSLLFLAGDHGDVGLYQVGIGARPEVKLRVGGLRMLTAFSVSQSERITFAACTPESPGDVYCTTDTGRRERRVTDFNADFLAEHSLAASESLRYLAPDGRAIQGWLVKPVGYRVGKKYPLILNMHGGPHLMWGPSYPSMWLEFQVQAARGYAVFYCNPRGSEGYGEDFATAIQNDWGNPVMHDILSGVDLVVQRGIANPRRMAVTGGSYAGYMTAWIIGHDHRFKCAWAQRGLYNLPAFYGVTDVPQLIEREFETLVYDDLDKLWQQSPLAYVREIRTPLVIEHQDQDWRCPPSDAEQLYSALKRLKRPVIMYRYPREGHEMSRAGELRHRVDRLERMLVWFDEHCGNR